VCTGTAFTGACAAQIGKGEEQIAAVITAMATRIGYTFLLIPGKRVFRRSKKTGALMLDSMARKMDGFAPIYLSCLLLI
jgi:hypothetical protein